MSKFRVLILIPARFSSSRFPGKPLVLINGVSMIERVYKNCSLAACDGIEFESYVVTDDEKIENHVKDFLGKVVRVDDEVISGTLRIQLAYERYFSDKNFDLVINVQGDEPLLEATELVALTKFHLLKKFDVATLVKKQMGFDDTFRDSNKVKVALSEKSGKAFYFSRAAIPFKRDLTENSLNDYWFLHIGVYSYRPKALLEFASNPETRLEDLEKLEQLRGLEIGLNYGALETKSHVMGVDHPEDVKKIEEVLNGRK